MRTGYVGLVKIELPAHTAYLTDGGIITFDGDDYSSRDDVLGGIAFIEPMTEGKTGEIPALDIGYNIPNATAITTFTSGALQESSIRVWLAKYDVDTNAIIGTPDPKFIGLVDQPNVTVKKAEYSLALSCVPKAEAFFQAYTGNSLSATFHKSLFPGETGHDNATGLSVPTAWGTESAGGGGSSASYGRGYGTGGDGSSNRHQN
jgi:hypothetical protein